MKSWKQKLNAEMENKEKRRFTNFTPHKSLDSIEVYTFVFFL